MKEAFYVGQIVMGLLLLGCGRAAEPNEIVVEVSEQGYLPSEVTVPVGKATRLTLSNVGAEEHDLGIVEIPLVTRGGGGGMANMPGMSGTGSEMATPLQLHVVTAAGASNSLDITPTKVGEYEFRCQIDGHSEAGTLVVTRSAE